MATGGDYGDPLGHRGCLCLHLVPHPEGRTMKLEPTPEQLETVARAIAEDDLEKPDWENRNANEQALCRLDARVAWNAIAPMVLEAAAAKCDESKAIYRGGYESRGLYCAHLAAGALGDVAHAIRAMKGGT